MSSEKSELYAEREDYILEFLRDEGYRPSIDEDGDVSFKREGVWYFITLDDKDEQYYRLCKPPFWPIESAPELEWALKAANKGTGGIKVAKVFVTNDLDNVAATAECFQPNIETFTLVLERLLNALATVYKDFVVEMHSMREESERKEDGDVSQSESMLTH